MENLVGTGIRISPSHIKELDKIAKQKRVSRNVVILWALDEYLAVFSLPDCPETKTDDQEENHPTTPAVTN